MDKKQGFVFYESWWTALANLPRDIQGEVLTAIIKYGLYGETTENLKPIAKAVLELVKPQIDTNKQRYLNGLKGGRPKGFSNNPNDGKGKSNNQELTKIKPKSNQNQTYNNNDKEKEKENDNVNKKAVAAALPPAAIVETAAAKLKRDVEYQKTQIIWKTGICMKFHIDELRVNGYLDEFYTDMLCRGYHVTNLPSLFTSWLSDKLDQSKKQARNETPKTHKDDRFLERRGTEPSSEDRKGFKGTF